jgi:hypothetical protein
VDSKARIYIALLFAAAVGMVAMTASQSTTAELVQDENGVIMYDYGGSVGAVYNPNVVAQHGIMNHDSYRLTGDLHRYDAGDWSYCDLEGNRARDNYH